MDLYDVVAPEAEGVDPAAVAALVERARREIDAELLPSCQLALARNGRLVAWEAIGDATLETRYVMFSCTKGLIAGAIWLLLQDGSLALDTRAGDLIPEFATNGKEVVTVEQLLTHTSGFPYAPMGPAEWGDRDARLARFSRWRLNWEPGTRFEYHPTAAHWVLAELITRVSGQDHRDFVHARIVDPLGLAGPQLGVAPADQGDIATLVSTGAPTPPEELRAVFGIDEFPLGEVTAEALLMFNDPAARAAGVPGAGGIATAADLALYYQALLHDPGDLWDPALLADASRTIRCTLPDPMTNVASNRSLGLVVAGDDGLSFMRSNLGRTVSAQAFGHAGAGGQIAWADPARGLSFAYLTNGLDQDILREGKRSVGLSSRAAVCVPQP